MRGRAEAVLHGLSSRRSAGRASCRVAGESGRDHGRSSGNQRGQPVVMVEQGRVLPWWQDPKPFHRLPAAARPAGIRQRASVGVCQTGASHLNPPSAWRMTPCGSSSTPPISTAPGQADQPTAVAHGLDRCQLDGDGYVIVRIAQAAQTHGYGLDDFSGRRGDLVRRRIDNSARPLPGAGGEPPLLEDVHGSELCSASRLRSCRRLTRGGRIYARVVARAAGLP
jgi:hypothetical protein